MAADKPSAQPNGTTFLIRVQFRQNATWQGRIEWLEGKKTRPFRSLLEMSQLMQEAWEETMGIEPGKEFASWDEKDEVS